MTGRMFLAPARQPLPKHAAIVFGLGRMNLIFEDTRYFGRLTLDASALSRLGPEPLNPEFTPAALAGALDRSAQPVKVKLLDQSIVAGLGNIYASEALFRARLSPCLAARKLAPEQIRRLWRAIRQVLTEAIACGSTVPLYYAGRDGLFYFGRAADSPDFYAERLRVYDREGKPCCRCGVLIKRIVQAARSSFYCPHCQQAGCAAQRGKKN
jgi:formamidopyrimidine-DNA glycosylase